MIQETTNGVVKRFLGHRCECVNMTVPELVIRLIGKDAIVGYMQLQAAFSQVARHQLHLSRNLPALAACTSQAAFMQCTPDQDLAEGM